jgi:nuclear GTP-binding protein
MESDDLKHIIPRKRSRSPPETPTNPYPNSPSNMAVVDNSDLSRYTRQPKRARKAKAIPTYDAPPDSHVLQQMGRSNPLGRKTLKRDAKQVRKAHRNRTHNAGGSGAGMDVDDEGLQFTFMA